MVPPCPYYPFHVCQIPVVYMRKRKRAPITPLPMLEIPIESEASEDEIQFMRSFYGSIKGNGKKHDEDKRRMVVKAVA